MTGNAAGVNNFTLARLLNKLIGGCLRTKNNAIYIDMEQSVQLLLSNFQKRRNRFDARIVNKNIQPSKVINRFFHQIELIVPFGYITLHTDYIIVLPSELSNRLIQQRFVYVMKHNTETIFAQSFCNTFS
ncbi:hypothetical protein D3C73_965110 [compost metagenome]